MAPPGRAGYHACNTHRPMVTHVRRNEIRLLRIHELVGKPVIAAPAGDRRGRVADILIDDGTHRVIGLLLRGRPFGRARILPYVQVRSFEDSAVIVESNAALLPMNAWAERARVARLTRLRGKPLVTSAGDNVGTISDAFVDPGSGDVRALE